jgi:hypothetical protein
MRLVATYNFGQLPYADHTVRSMRDYAHRTGADFIEHTRFHHQGLYGQAPCWFKIEAIRRFVAQREYRSMLLLDADAMILPACDDLFEQVRAGEIGAVADMGMPEKDGRFERWSASIPWAKGSDFKGRYFNAGVLLITHGAACKLDTEGLLSGPFPEVWAFDQDYLNLAVSAASVPIRWLPNECNWLAPQDDGAGDKKIVHFVGDHKHLITSSPRKLTDIDP